jgi:ankyrin repeat protein
MINGTLTILFILIVLASTFLARSLLIPMLILGIGALFMAIASAGKIIRQPKVERIFERKLFAPLVLYLLGIAFPASLYLSLYAGLGHSARAQALLGWQWLLVFILIVACPTVALILYRYYRVSLPPNARRTKAVVGITVLTISVIIIGLIVQIGGWPPILLAARHNFRGLEKVLIRVGADLNVKDKYDGATPLRLAIWRQDVEMVKLLLERGAEVNGRYGPNHWSYLFYAEAKGNGEIVKLLLDKEADVQARNKNGWTVLMKAFGRGDMEMVKLLIAHGATFHPNFVNGYEIMMDAVKRGDRDEVKRLLDREAWRNTKTPSQIRSEIVSATQRGRSEEFRLLLELGAEVNTRAPSSHTLLMLACQGEHEDIVKMLLEKGAEVNARDQGGKTALWYAAEKGNPEIIQLLLDRGADAIWPRKADRTALRRAATKDDMRGLKNLVEKERLRSTLSREVTLQ